MKTITIRPLYLANGQRAGANLTVRHGNGVTEIFSYWKGAKGRGIWTGSTIQGCVMDMPATKAKARVAALLSGIGICAKPAAPALPEAVKEAIVGAAIAAECAARNIAFLQQHSASESAPMIADERRSLRMASVAAFHLVGQASLAQAAQAAPLDEFMADCAMSPAQFQTVEA